MMELRLVSVNVGMPREIGLLHGEPVLSGIAKVPLESSTVFVGATNIDGDGQADLSVHGGVDKAVYCYPADQLAVVGTRKGVSLPARGLRREPHHRRRRRNRDCDR